MPLPCYSDHFKREVSKPYGWSVNREGNRKVEPTVVKDIDEESTLNQVPRLHIITEVKADISSRYDTKAVSEHKDVSTGEHRKTNLTLQDELGRPGPINPNIAVRCAV